MSQLPEPQPRNGCGSVLSRLVFLLSRVLEYVFCRAMGRGDAMRYLDPLPAPCPMGPAGTSKGIIRGRCPEMALVLEVILRVSGEETEAYRNEADEECVGQWDRTSVSRFHFISALYTGGSHRQLPLLHPSQRWKLTCLIRMC